MARRKEKAGEEPGWGLFCLAVAFGVVVLFRGAWLHLFWSLAQ